MLRTLGDNELIIRFEEYVEIQIADIDDKVFIYLEDEDTALSQSSFQLSDLCHIFSATKEFKQLDRYELNDLFSKLDMMKLNEFIRELRQEIANNPEMQTLLEDVPLNDIDFTKKPVIIVKQLKMAIILFFFSSCFNRDLIYLNLSLKGSLKTIAWLKQL